MFKQWGLCVFVATWAGLASANVYRCETGAGQVAYQAAPCDASQGARQKVLPPPPAPVPSPATAGRPATAPGASQTSAGARSPVCSGQEMSIAFRDMPLRTTLEVIANFAGKRLVMVNPVQGGGPVQYVCTPWNTILQDLATRHRFSVRVDGAQIVVQPR